MIVTLSFNLDNLLDALDLELVEEFDEEYDIDEDGIVWYYDDEIEAVYYFDEDLDDWAEVDENGDVWYLDEETDVLYFYDDESDEWVECEEDDSASW